MRDLIKIESSMVYAIGYNPKSKELEVVFDSGKIWMYAGVPKDIYKELMNAASVGRYMRDCIIDCYDSYPIKS